MGNRSGQFYGYTGLFPVLEDAQASHVDALRQALAAMEDGPGSLFSRTGLVHGARLFVIDDVVYNGAPSREEHLEYSYLAVSVTFDGDLPGLAQRLASVGEPEIGRLFSHCYGCPAERSAAALLAYLQACQVTTTFLFTDQDQVDLSATLRALRIQRIVSEMVARGQGLDAAARKALVRQTQAKIAALPDIVPGGFGGGAA